MALLSSKDTEHENGTPIQKVRSRVVNAAMSDTAATSVLTPCYVVGGCNHFGCRSSPAADAAIG